MADILVSKIQIPSLPNDNLILKDAEARQDLSTALATATGNPLNFSTRSAQKANETVISLEPIQDLHGYDHPWPGGGGKNKLPSMINTIKAYNPTATWNGNVGTKANVTFELVPVSYNSNVLDYVIVNGTTVGEQTSQSISIVFNDYEEGNYLFNAVMSDQSIGVEAFIYDNANNARAKKWDKITNSDSCTKASDDNEIYLQNNISYSYVIRLGLNRTVNNVIVKPMIRLATETDPTFAPYENKCPIDGRTETSLGGCGKNELPMTVTEIKSANTNGTWNGNVYTYNGITWTLQSDGTVITNGTATANSQYYIPVSGLSGNFYYNGCPSGGGRNIYDVYAWDDTTNTRYYKWDETTTSVSDYGPYDSQEIDIPEDHGGRIICRIYNGVTANNLIFKPMIRLASNTDATYEPFVQSNNLTIQFGEKVYGAKVELEKGTVTVDTAIVDMGDLTWNRYTSYTYVFFLANLSSLGIKTASVGDIDIISETYKVIGATTLGGTNGFGNNPHDGEICQQSSGTACMVQDSQYSSTTAEAFTTAVTGTKLLFKLATPRTITFTPNEISLLMGINNISTDGDNITLTYRDGKVATLGDLDGLVKKIVDCEDVEITDLQAGDSLVWDVTTGKWKNQANTHVYSTTEQIVGTWVDGSTIYEKTITGLSFTTVLDGWADSGASLSDVDKVIRCECGQNVSSMIEICFAKVDNGELYIWTTNRVTYEFNNIVIQYTKNNS